MKSLLIVTLFDYKYVRNNRIHHLLDHLTDRFDTATMICKDQVTHDMSFWEQVKRLFIFSISRVHSEKFMVCRVNPFFNHVEALGIALTQLDVNRRKPGFLRRAIWKLTGGMGLLAESGVIISFLLAYIISVRRRFDVFIGQGPLEVMVGFILQRCGFIRLLVYDDMDYVPGYSPHAIRRIFLERLERYLIRRSDLVISVGAFLAELREEETGRKVVIIPNGVDYELFKTAQNKVPHPPTLLYMGFVEEWSGLDLVLEALSRLVYDIPDVRLLILGHTTPQYMRRLERLAEDHSVRRSFNYIGNKDYNELVNYLKEADIGLAVFKPIDLRKYAFSLKVIEYMAAGLPVVTTMGTQSASVVTEYDCGMVVPYEKDALYKSLLSLLTDKEQYSNLSRNACKYSQEFKWDDLMDRTYQVIQEAYEYKEKT